MSNVEAPQVFFEHSVSEPLNVSVHGAELILKELDWFAINKYDGWPSFSLFFLFLLVFMGSSTPEDQRMETWDLISAELGGA